MPNVEFTAEYTALHAAVAGAILLMALSVMMLGAVIGNAIRVARKNIGKGSRSSIVIGIILGAAISTGVGILLWSTAQTVTIEQTVNEIEAQLGAEVGKGEFVTLDDPENTFQMRVGGDEQLCRVKSLGSEKIGEQVQLLVECTSQEPQYAPVAPKEK